MSEREQVELLTGPEARDLLAAALGTAGAEIDSWAVHSLHHRPGAGVSVGYTVTVRAPDGGAQYVCATTSRLTRTDSPGLVRLDRPDGRVTVHVWRHPHDPELPALPRACDGVAMSELTGEAVVPHMVAYRPTRRCVLRLEGGGMTRAYAKVVRPKVQDELVRRHQLLAGAGVPVPRILHSAPGGLVVIAPATGIPMANFLAAGLTDPVTTLDAAVAVLDALPAEVLGLRRHPSWAERVEHYAHAAATALPERAGQAEAIARVVAHVMETSDPGPVVPTHGDYYEANILLADPARVSSVLDVDAVGPGHRVDDLACLLGHVSVLPHLAPSVYPHVAAVLEEWWRRASSMADPRALAARAAAVTLSLVAGAKRPAVEGWQVDARGRLDEAERWLGRA